MELAERLEVTNVTLIPYQVREVLSDSLSSAHLHYLGLTKGLSGFVVPSRAYGVLSAGRPLLVSADQGCETARLVRSRATAASLCHRPAAPARRRGDPRRLRGGGPTSTADWGARGRAYAEQNADRSVAISRYRALLGELSPPPTSLADLR